MLALEGASFVHVATSMIAIPFNLVRSDGVEAFGLDMHILDVLVLRSNAPIARITPKDSQMVTDRNGTRCNGGPSFGHLGRWI